MQKKPAQFFIPSSLLFFLEIKRIANQRMVEGQHVHANLVHAAGMGFDAQ